MRFASILLLAAAAAATGAHGQSFTNLDFEAASAPASTPGIQFLDWGSAAPGWGHSSGADTSLVYYGGTHVGTTQWFLLADAATPAPGALAGAYSLQFASGYDSSDPAGAQWVNAYLSQTGLVPVDARSLTLLASGPLGVAVNGTAVPLLALGDLRYAVDLSAYAGQSVELRFINTSSQLFDAVTLDNLAFSTSPVPEPPVWLLMGLAAVGVPALRRARKR